MLRPARAGLVRFCGPRGGLGAWARPDRSGGGVWFGMIQHTTRTTKEVRTIPLVGGALAMLIAGLANLLGMGVAMSLPKAGKKAVLF